MLLKHQYARPHLFCKCVHVHVVVDELECGVGVAQAVQSPVLSCFCVNEQACVLHEHFEGLMQVVCNCAVTKPEHRQVEFLCKQFVKRQVPDVVTAFVNAL